MIFFAFEKTNIASKKEQVMCKKNILFKISFAFLSALCAAVFLAMYFLSSKLPTSYKVFDGQVISFDTGMPVTITYDNAKLVQSKEVESESNISYNVELKLFGVFPIRAATVDVIDEMYVSVLGKPFGIKIYSEGVMVVGMTDVDGADGLVNPALVSGIKKGDIIISIGGVDVSSNEEVAEIIEKSNGIKQSFLIKRNNIESTIDVIPIKSASEDKYKIGIWVRDSSAGIGTLTFYSPSNNLVCGLGHGICDSDTGEIIPLNSGEFVNAAILSVTKGTSGFPGELRGHFSSGTLASILENDVTGVFGEAVTKFPVDNLMPIALKQDIVVGSAQILTTIDDTGPCYYDCKIEKVHFNDDSLTQNIIISITDTQLIKRTGGIVQGMSGSPIIQNGKLVGAITHVFINDSTKGYGIFAENMFNTAKSLNLESMQKAS